MKDKLIIFFAILLCCHFTLYAVNEDAGTSGFAFMKMLYSARTAGMGNAFTGRANDADAVFFNTAGIVQTPERHIKTTYMNYIEGMQGGSMTYADTIDEVWHFAPFVQFMISDDIPETIEIDGQYGGTIGTFNTSHFVVGIGFAREIHEVIDFGINAKYFYEKLYEDNTASALAFDFSFLHQTNNPDLKVGGSIKNVGKQLSFYTDSEYEEKMPMMAVAGVSYSFFDKGFINFDLCRPFDNDFYGKLGIEYFISKYLTLRTGLDTRMEDYKAGDDLDALSGLSFGLGVNWSRYMFDYAVYSMGSFGLVNQISVSYKF